jgi:hypothetical protein
MALQSIGIGSAANDGTGDPLRTAFDKINDNFNELYVQLGGNSLSNVTFSSNTITNFDTNGDITIATNGTGTLFIDSNVEFRGTATEINTTTLQVEDNLLELNRNSSGGDVDSGFFVNRGNALNSAFFYWNEGEDKFKAVLSSSDDSVSSAVTDTSTATIVANIDATSAAIDTITALAEGRVTVNDSMQIRGGLSINNNDSSSLALSVEGSIDVTDVIDCLSLSASTSVSCADITAVGTVNANIIDAQIFQTSDSTAIQINEGINVSGAINTATSLEIGNSVIVTGILDEDTLASDSAVKLATQQSIKAYVDAENNAQVLAVSGDDSATLEVNLAGGLLNISGGTNITTSSNSEGTLTIDLDGAPTLTALQVDNLNLNGNTLSSTAGTDLLITPLAGQQIVLDGTIVVDAGVVTGATSITSTALVATTLGVSGLTTLTGSFLPAIHTFVATDAITVAEHAGRTLLLGEVGGNALVTLTLPDATGSGATYKFIVSVTNTSNYVIAVPDAANTIDGVMLYLDEDGTAVTAFPTVAASDTITLNGTTTGGVLGDYLEIVDIAADQYHVRGVMRVPAGSNPVTPFSEAVS